MKMIVNERGESIVAVGAEGSMARTLEIYPDTIALLITIIKEKGDSKDDFEEVFMNRGIRKYDRYRIMEAARFYSKRA